MQYKVPQHVDIEDKVVGSLTIRQFLIVLVGVAFIGLFKIILVGPLAIFFWPITIVIGGIFGAVAFAKYGDQNMEVFLLSAIKTFTNPRKRIWQKEPYRPTANDQRPTTTKTEASPAESRVSITQAHDDLEKLAEVVDSGGYSTLATNERSMNFGQPTTTAVDAKDILEKAEVANPEVDAMLTEASKVAPKREDLVSDVASVLPSQKQETPTIKLRKDQFYKEIR
jgi:hypothetical protein